MSSSLASFTFIRSNYVKYLSFEFDTCSVFKREPRLKTLRTVAIAMITYLFEHDVLEVLQGFLVGVSVVRLKQRQWESTRRRTKQKTKV